MTPDWGVFVASLFHCFDYSDSLFCTDSQSVGLTCREKCRLPLKKTLNIVLFCFFNMEYSPSSFTRPTLSRKVPPCKPGPARGFFLLKGGFPCHCADLGVPAPGFWLCKAPRDNFIVKGAIQINWIELNIVKQHPVVAKVPCDVFFSGYTLALASLTCC